MIGYRIGCTRHWSLSVPSEVTRKLIHEPSYLLGDPSAHRVLGIGTDADSKRFEKTLKRALQHKVF